MESNGFQEALDHIRGQADTEFAKGRLFERLMARYFRTDPLYSERFSRVYLWADWAGERGLNARDTGIDLVAEERDGGYCAIQCKCYGRGTRITKAAIDSFLSASAREPYTSGIIVDTGKDWSANALATIENLRTKCHVLRFDDLASQAIDWPDLAHQEPEALRVHVEPFTVRPHQQEALAAVEEGFSEKSRGKLVMACGTGKTFTALRIAESLVGAGGRVLYLVPSIALFQQTMREWAEQKEVPHRYVGICSDTRAGKVDEDASLQELEIPVTTDPELICDALQAAPADVMTVVFSTYQSLELVRRSQEAGAPQFDLTLCDEAHRTTGVERPGDRTSPFVLVHDEEAIRSARRLYMTATPRLYTEGAKAKADRHGVPLYSMDDELVYGPEFHRLPFSRAVEQGLLSDYRVAIFTVSEDDGTPLVQESIKRARESGKTMTLSDTARINGCWQALQKPEGPDADADEAPPLRRAIAFSNSIAASENFKDWVPDVLAASIEHLPEDQREGAYGLETEHVDGRNHALERKAKLDWLRGETPNACRILSNARCLSEGVDVPALDAVLFLSPRNSPVDVVQAVGRVMRKAPGKRYGYIILPVTIPPGADPMQALDHDDCFGAVWSVLQALRSHDETFDAEVNQLDLNRQPSKRIIFGGAIDSSGQLPEQGVLPFPPLDLPPGAVYAKIVEKCGDREYWRGLGRRHCRNLHQTA